MSRTAIDNQIWAVTRYMMERIGVDAAQRAVSPLSWYIDTGRASIAFLHWFIDAKPFVVARILMKGGSDDSIIAALKAKSGI